MQKSVFKKGCPFHDNAPIKYFCMSPNCESNSQLACSDCMVEGPHQQHNQIKIEEFMTKLNNIYEFSKKQGTRLQEQKKLYAPKSKQEQQQQQNNNNNQNQQIPVDLILPQLQSMSDQIFEYINTQNNLLVNELQQKFSQQFQETFLNSLQKNNEENNDAFQIYKNLETILLSLNSFELNQLKVSQNQILTINELLNQPENSLNKKLLEYEQIQKENKQNQQLQQNDGLQMDQQCNQNLKNCSQIIKQKLPVIKQLFQQFLVDTLNPYIQGILFDLENSDCKYKNQELARKAFNMDQFQMNLIKNYQIHESGLTQMCHLKNNIVATSSHEKLIKIWDYQNGNIVHTIDDQAKGSIISIMKMEEANLFISAGYDKCLRFHDLNTFITKKQIENVHNDCIIQLEKLNSRFFASASDDFSIKTWQILDFNRIIVKDEGKLDGHSDCVKALASVGDDVLVSGGSDNKVIVWEWKVKKIRFILNGHKDWVRCLCTISNQFVASGGNDKKIIIWDVKDGNQIRELSENQTGSISSIIRLGEQYIATCSFGGQGKFVVYDWKAGKTAKQITSGNSGFHSLLQVSQQDILQGMGDGRVILWQ